MKEMWDKRYATESYVYGIDPNSFFKQELETLTPGKLLLPAEGEGRNAVFAAQLGWSVEAFDYSEKAKTKALQLAKKLGQDLKYTVADIGSFQSAGAFDCIGLIYAHMPGMHRENYHRKLLEFLNPGGIVILEGFSKEQLGKNSGGPQMSEMLFSEEELRSDFKAMADIRVLSAEVELDEGTFHKGVASVIRLVARKPL